MTLPFDDRARSLRVLAWPHERTRNIYTHDLYRHIGDHRDPPVTVDEYRVGRGWRRRADIVHVHWPEIACDPRPAWRAATKATVVLLDLLLCRLRGARIVWSRHDSGSHEQVHPRLERRYTRLLRRMTSAVIHLSEAAAVAEAATGAVPRPTTIIPLGPPSTPGDLPDRTEARRQLGLPGGTIMATVGRLQRYKQVPALIDAFTQAALPGVHLVIAGETPDTDEGRAIEDAASGSDQVIVRRGWLEERDFHLYLRAADVVVLAYADHLNSGVALFALGAGTPVAVSASPAIEDLRVRYGDAWVRIIGPSVDATVLSRLVEWGTTDADRPEIELTSWEQIAEDTVACYLAARRGA